MAIYYPGCDTDELPDYQCDDCNDYEKGRVRSAGFVTDAYYTTLIANPTNVTLWTTGIASGDIIIIPKVTGTLDAPDPITGPGYGNDTESILGRDFTLVYRDPNYKGNCNFYNTLKRKNGFYHAIYRTGTQTHISDITITIDTRAPVTENLEDNVEWNVSSKWRSQDNPCPFDTPAGIFECFQVV
jgi:hypothetical protein